MSMVRHQPLQLWPTAMNNPLAAAMGVAASASIDALGGPRRVCATARNYGVLRFLQLEQRVPLLRDRRPCRRVARACEWREVRSGARPQPGVTWICRLQPPREVGLPAPAATSIAPAGSEQRLAVHHIGFYNRVPLEVLSSLTVAAGSAGRESQQARTPVRAGSNYGRGRRELVVAPFTVVRGARRQEG
jgi:hypothetical protein